MFAPQGAIKGMPLSIGRYDPIFRAISAVERNITPLVPLRLVLFNLPTDSDAYSIAKAIPPIFRFRRPGGGVAE